MQHLAFFFSLHTFLTSDAIITLLVCVTIILLVVGFALRNFIKANPKRLTIAIIVTALALALTGFIGKYILPAADTLITRKIDNIINPPPEPEKVSEPSVEPKPLPAEPEKVEPEAIPAEPEKVEQKPEKETPKTTKPKTESKPSQKTTDKNKTNWTVDAL